MKKLSGKRYFYWLGGCHRRKGYPVRTVGNWPDWAWIAYYKGHYDQRLIDDSRAEQMRERTEGYERAHEYFGSVGYE